ncbi:uncharacterized protein Gasu_57730 [Galdieria sulphuraria]|uniref:Uncharacterized protein n=1 Tax=Galdieria sulphuraria TaxID=130081 RepID=M2XT83_GALSU|nr:uncharacterized protein Gasu_57730 [Galdieria sulphuraria]EME26654.1 hypothetical protein Gasu_57730 [Galdieria sulphuraria]|eukprot:XP_005703174.1 hypothetical protein Gasu_57730 [Galdieria sulphuraria]
MCCTFVSITRPFVAIRHRKEGLVTYPEGIGTSKASKCCPLLRCHKRKENFRRQEKVSFKCVLEKLSTWMTHLTNILGDNTKKLWRQTTQAEEQQTEGETVQYSVVYSQKQLLKGQLENILRDFYFLPHTLRVGTALSHKLSRNVTLSHPVLERLGFPVVLHIPKLLFLLFISSFSFFKNWLKIEFLSLDDMEYLSPEEGQLVARFHLCLAVNNRKVQQVVFLRIHLDSNGNIMGWQERWSESIADLSNIPKTVSNLSNESKTLFHSNGSCENSSSSNMEKTVKGGSLDIAVLQKNLFSAFLRKKTYIQRSEWYHSRVNKIINWSKEQAPRLFSSPVDLGDIYSEFVELENPFVVAYGISAVQQVHRGIRILTRLLFQYMDCNIMSVVHPNPETVIAVYRIYGKGRFLGGRVQYLSRNIMTIDLEGKIVRHQETWNVERNEIVKMWLSNE